MPDFRDTGHSWQVAVSESGTCTRGLRIFRPKHAMFTALASSPRVRSSSTTNTQGSPRSALNRKHWVHWRWQCPTFLRQTFVEWAAQTINKSFWANRKHWVHWRWQCPTFLRQTFVEWAAQTINKSFWAGAYYRQQKAKGYSSTPQFDADVVPQPYIWEGKKGNPSTRVKPFNLETRRTIDREIVERSEAYIASHAQSRKPFFAYIALTQVHPPLGYHPDFDNASRVGLYGDILMELDYNVGRILDVLSKAGVVDNTVVILSGDNGAVTDGIGGGSTGPWRGGFTGYEGGLRTVGMIRWPEKIEAGRVSDEIFSTLDWMPTLASLIGEKNRLPDDRPIDGVDQSAFIKGEQEKSNRDHILFYIGDDLYSVKWRSFKIHLKTTETLWSPVQTYQFPPVYDVANDPGEDNNLMKFSLFAHSWVYVPMGRILQKTGASMQKYPNIKPGEDFKGY